MDPRKISECINMGDLRIQYFGRKKKGILCKPSEMHCLKSKYIYIYIYIYIFWKKKFAIKITIDS